MSPFEITAPVSTPATIDPAHAAAARRTSLIARGALAAATAGAGLGAGLFYGYQVSVIRALAEVDDVAYVATFRAINDKIQNPWFFLTFLGTPPLIVAALVLNRAAPKPVRALIVAGLALTLASFAITAAGNVPLNDALAASGATAAGTAATARAHFEQPWNRLHLARTLAAVAGFFALTLATLLSPAPGPDPEPDRGAD